MARKCKCGQTNPTMFYRDEKSRCINCRTIYNQEYYKKKKAGDLASRKLREGKRLICQDAGGEVLFNCSGAFMRFCQARRNMRGWKADQHSYCNQCALQDKVDGGFIPKNIGIKEAVLLMAIG